MQICKYEAVYGFCALLEITAEMVRAGSEILKPKPLHADSPRRQYTLYNTEQKLHLIYLNLYSM